MGFFATGTLPDGKTQLRPVPASADPLKWLTHTNWNDLCAGVKDLRTNMHKATTKGDLNAFDGTNYGRLAVGSDTQVLTADSTQPYGVKWAAGGGAAALGNFTFTANAGDLSGANVMTLGATNATGVTISRSAGLITLAGDVVFAANKAVSMGAGAGAFDFSLVTGTFKTPTGVNTIGGATVFAANKGITVTAGTSAFDFSGGTGIFKTTTGASTFGGSSNAFTFSVTVGGNLSPSTDFSSYFGDSSHHWAGVYTNQLVTSTGSMVVSAATNIELSPGAANSVSAKVSGSNVARFYTNRTVLTPNVATSGAITALALTGAANTGQTASTEAPDVDFALNRTVQFATGALTTQRAMIITPPTYAFVGASTLTNAATLAITGAPVAGTNATITNSYALWVQAGRARFDGGIDGVGYIGSSDVQALGTATTTSTSFVDVGNGSSTGFATWTAPTTLVTKTYTMRVVVRSYMSTLGSSVTTYFQVLQDGVAVSGQPTATASQAFGTTTQYIQTTWSLSVPCTAGSAHVYKLQWKVGNASDTASVTATVGTLQYFLEG